MSTEYSKTQKPTREAVSKKPVAKAPTAQESLTPENTLPIADIQRAVNDPHTARPTDILGLQRHYGNHAVQRLLISHNIQTKLTVGAADDVYEQEADRVAAQVMSMPAQTPTVQRIGEEEDDIQVKPLAATVTPLVQRIEDPSGSSEVGNHIEDRLAAKKGGGTPLPNGVRIFMEERFGADLGNVRLHADGESARLNHELSAQAFTHGQDIYMGGNNNRFDSDEGKRLLAHELTHVFQQGAAGSNGARPAANLPPVQQKLQRVRGRRDSVMSQFREGNIKLSLFLSGLIPLSALGLEYISDDLKEALIKKGLATEEEIDEYNSHAAGDSSDSSSSSSAAAPAVSSNAAMSAASVG